MTRPIERATRTLGEYYARTANLVLGGYPEVRARAEWSGETRSNGSELGGLRRRM